MLIKGFSNRLSAGFLSEVNPSRPNPGLREKINLNFYFPHFFVVPQKVLERP